MARSVTSVGPSVDFTGPFFQADPGKTIMENVTKMMQAFADEGAQVARERLAAGSTGRDLVRLLDDRVADHVVGRVMSRSDLKWRTAAVVQVYNKGLSGAVGRSLMAAASEVEAETHAMRAVTRQLRASRAVLRANLTAGLE